MILEIILDGTLMVDRATLHDQLAEKFAFPDYYGRNLDALFDLLTEYPGQVNVVLFHANQLRENLGRYGKAFLETVMDASDRNPGMTFLIYDENI